jgi:predicted permease
MLTAEFVKACNSLNFKVTLPVLLFKDISRASIQQQWNTKLVLFCAGATVISIVLIWILVRLLVKDRTITGALVQASFRSSAAVLGVAFIQNIYGDAGMAPIMIIGCVPLYNIFSVIILTFESNGTFSNQNSKIKDSLTGILKNPIIISIAIGLIVSLSHLHFPPIVDKTVDSIANLATPLALLAMGAGFEGKKALAKIKPTIAGTLVKLLVLPGVFLPIAAFMGFRDAEMMAILIMLAGPTTVSCYIMAQNMDNDGVLTSSIVAATTLLSAVTLTGWIFLSKSLGWI